MPMKFPPLNPHNLDFELSLRLSAPAVDCSLLPELVPEPETNAELMQEELLILCPPLEPDPKPETPLLGLFPMTTNQIMHPSTSSHNSQSLRVRLPTPEPEPKQETLDLSTPLLGLFPATTNQNMHPPTSSSRNSQSLRVRQPKARTRTRTRASPRRARQAASPSVRRRRSRTELKNTPIKPPYPWSTENRAVVHNLNYLRENQIVTITGDVKCDRCEKQYKIEYDLMAKFEEIASFIEKNKDTLHDRAPDSWTSPNFLDCKLCGEEQCVRPVIPEGDHKNINWLFLLLGQMIGRLKLDHLKYFCAYTNNHRTGAKNRLVYLTYLTLCNQLQPSIQLFHR